MNKGRFGFGRKDKDTPQNVDDAALGEVRNLQQEALEKANLLLHSEPCKDLLARYKAAERETIDVLIKYSKDELDPMKFSHGARVLLLQLVNLRALINTLHAKAGQEYKDV